MRIMTISFRKILPKEQQARSFELECFTILNSGYGRIRRKHIFGDGSKDVQLSCEDDLRRKMFSSIDKVTAEIRKRFQQLQNIAQKLAFLRPEVTFIMDEINFDQTPQNVNEEEFQLERVTSTSFYFCNRPWL
ncbi:uncharacterized protein TNCV_2515561 [Trichonephila clavipes]|nr:uncharacterized protein TNCV_2515561 [Trichonephila clavipes]